MLLLDLAQMIEVQQVFTKKDKSFIDPLEHKVKLQGVESSSQVSKLRYSTHPRFGEEEEEEESSQESPTQTYFEVNTSVNPQLLTIHTEFIVDVDKLLKDFKSKENKIKRQEYKNNHRIQK